MKNFLILSLLVNFFGACGHKGHHGAGGCNTGKPCSMDTKEVQKAECEECKKTK